MSPRVEPARLLRASGTLAGRQSFVDFAAFAAFRAGACSFAALRPASQCATYFFAGTRLIASPITSSARSSTFLNRTHDLPISSFLPVLAHAS